MTASDYGSVKEMLAHQQAGVAVTNQQETIHCLQEHLQKQEAHTAVSEAKKEDKKNKNNVESFPTSQL